MPRLHLKNSVLALILICLVTVAIYVTFYHQTSTADRIWDFGDDRKIHASKRLQELSTGHDASDEDPKQESLSSEFYAVDCTVTSDSTAQCYRKGSEVFVPFSAVKKQFEIEGGLENDEKFHWYYGSSKSLPVLPYNSYGPFLHFANYNVESRDKVLCVSGLLNVPLSTQWDPKGYPYVIQIAQYGLSHYSKHKLLKKGPKVMQFGASVSDWSVPEGVTLAKGSTSEGLQFSVPVTSAKGLRLPFHKKLPSKLSVLRVLVKSADNFSVTVQVTSKDGNVYRLHYGTVYQSLLRFSADKSDIYYAIKLSKDKTELVRDVLVDIRKVVDAFGSSATRGKKRRKLERKKRLKRAASKSSSNSKFVIRRIQWLSLRGNGVVSKVEFCDEAHETFYTNAANWLIDNQREDGGWPIGVTRDLHVGKPYSLKPGWVSAMGQGQAMSLLVRMYEETHQIKYLQTAVKASVPFTKNSTVDGGVRAYLFGKFAWYEEYPISPGLYVLNGFIFSLFGLYDLRTVLTDPSLDVPADLSKYSAEVFNLYNEGLSSLRQLVNLFDSGSGTFYDLRHLTLGLEPRRARWDYHSVHIIQLMAEPSLQKDATVQQTLKRWQQYIEGYKSKHN